MSTTFLPLKWESTGEQWWYATPIDWAAANGLSDLVNELLRIDPNLLIKLTSLRRTRRLETVWDDADPTNNVARSRARVARALLSSPLIRAGYGGWLLYTAASAGDLGFVKELVERENVSVFGEGEYGITDILYAAARSRDSGVFRLLLDFAISAGKGEGEGNGEAREGSLWELMNRAVHAAARGGNLEVLKELLWDCPDILVYRDAEGSTVLHSAASRGQVEVVKGLIAMHDSIIDSTDNQGNTALHIAAYRGYSSVAEALALASPSLATWRNNDGDTILHLAVAGFRSPGFHRVDQQIDLMKLLVSGEIVNLKEIVNVRNNEGRTPLHVAVIENVNSDVVELLMAVRSINLNVRNVDGFTPLDLLRLSPRTATSELLMRRISTAGGISACQDGNALARKLRTPAIGTSPGTSFRYPDAEIFVYACNEVESEVECEPPSSRFSDCSSEPESQFDSTDQNDKRFSSGRLMFLFQRPSKGERKSKSNGTKSWREEKDEFALESFRATPLRQQFSRPSEPKGEFLSPLAKEKFAVSLMQGVIQATPPKSRFFPAHHSPSSPFSKSSTPSPTSVERLRDSERVIDGKRFRRSSFFSGPLRVERSESNDKHRRASSFSRSLMNQYFCFGAQGLAVEDSVTDRRASRSCRRLVF